MGETPKVNITHKAVTNDHRVDEALHRSLHNVYHTVQCKLNS